MPDNSQIASEVVQKAAFALSDVTGGKMELLPVYANQIMSVPVEKSVLIGQIGVESMKSPTARFPKSQFAKGFLHALNEDEDPPDAARAKPSIFSSVELTTVEVGGETFVSDQVIEDNFTGEKLMDVIKSEIMDAVSADMETAALTGDTTSSDTFLAKFDGFLKQITTNTFSAGDTKFSQKNAKITLQKLPKAFRVDRRRLRMFCGDIAGIDYSDALGSRMTPGGDKWLEDDAIADFHRVQIVPLPLMPENIGTGSHCTDVMITDPMNLKLGIHREIRVETQRFARKRATAIVITLRYGVAIGHEPATALTTNINSQAA